jgi:hypothetical protein
MKHISISAVGHAGEDRAGQHATLLAAHEGRGVRLDRVALQLPRRTGFMASSEISAARRLAC